VSAPTYPSAWQWGNDHEPRQLTAEEWLREEAEVSVSCQVLDAGESPDRERTMVAIAHEIAELRAQLAAAREWSRAIERERDTAQDLANRWMRAALYVTPGNPALVFDPMNPEGFAESRRRALEVRLAAAAPQGGAS